MTGSDERCSRYPHFIRLAARTEPFAAVRIPDPHGAVFCAEVIAVDDELECDTRELEATEYFARQYSKPSPRA